MIERFPKFSKLDIKHRKHIDAITKKFDPYSDFNFISLYAWDINNSAEISELNRNLVVVFPDYISGEQIYSVLGDNAIDNTLTELLSHFPKLDLIPDVVIKQITNKKPFNIKEDHANLDYIYMLTDHANYPGKNFREKRKKTNRFLTNFGTRLVVKPMDFTNQTHTNDVLKIFDSWAVAKNKQDDETIHERLATNRLLVNAKSLNATGLIVYIDSRPAGYSIYESRENKFATWHFHKCIPSYPNLDVFLTNVVSKELLLKGQEWINWEQDLGIPSLRRSKLSFKPNYFLKKYKVKLAD